MSGSEHLDERVDERVDDLLALAADAFAAADAERAIAHLSHAIRRLTELGEHRRAAMACVQMGEAYVSGLGNVVAGRAWFARAKRLVEAESPCIEQGWVAIAAMGCDVDDPAILRDAAELALDRARQFGDVNLETKALADAGLAHVQLGDLARGMALLDEAMALACGPADDLGCSARSVCSFFTVCSYAADFARASAWAELLSKRGVIGMHAPSAIYVSSHCESVRASLLVELGRWGEAEETLTRAQAAFEATLGLPSWHPAIYLADLRVRQGRLAEAEALLLAKEQAFEALLPAARLHLARGDHDLAAAMARRGLRVIGVDRLRVVAALTVLVDAELGRGDIGAARAAAAELEARAADVGVLSLRGRAAAVSARVLAASGDMNAAIELLEATADALDVDDLPYLRATVLIELAGLRERVGDVIGARVDARAAQRALSRLDVVLAPAEREIVERLAGEPVIGGAQHAVAPPGSARSSTGALLARSARGWVAGHDGASVRLADTKGMRYLAALIASAGTERHVLDLLDEVEGATVDLPRRRALATAADPALDAQARRAYRHRIEQLRSQAEEALADGAYGAADAAEDEIEALVGSLARAFGIGGRAARASGSAAEKARLNVTRAVRSAINKISETLPAGAALDRAVRTGLYCAYEPLPGDVRWIVQREVNGRRRD